MLGKGASKMQIYRYDGLKKLSEDILALDRYGLSPNTLYNAVGLTREEQKLLADKVTAIMAASEDPSMSRAEFNAAVHSIKDLRNAKEAYSEKNKQETETRSPYESQLIKSSETFLKRLMKAKSEEEKQAALRELRSLRIRLDEAERSLKGE
jgi:glycyl-tRNA synthetase beta subunit